jgi:secreted PhoX family phosphatase
MSRCDGIRTTPWGTILATEENGADGRAYEFIDPLGTTGHWIASRLTGDVRDGIGSATPSAAVVQRPALGSFSWEGLEVLEAGVVIAGDELSPSLANEGGAIFKLIPGTPRAPGTRPIADLALSPLANGTLYALRIQSGSSTYGQGFQRGTGVWIGPVSTADPTLGVSSRQWAINNNATGYYRPEDLHGDPTFAGPGVRVFWTNTGNASAQFYAETLQMVDPAPESSASDPAVQTFVEGYPRFASHDNLDVNPVTGHVYVIKDDEHGDIWACLPDVTDNNLVSDGCVTLL